MRLIDKMSSIAAFGAMLRPAAREHEFLSQPVSGDEHVCDFIVRGGHAADMLIPAGGANGEIGAGWQRV